jgi:hypothetical protein
MHFTPTLIVFIIAVNMLVFGLMFKKGLAVVGFYLGCTAIVVTLLHKMFTFIF